MYALMHYVIPMCMYTTTPPLRCASTFLVWLLQCVISMANNTGEKNCLMWPRNAGLWLRWFGWLKHSTTTKFLRPCEVTTCSYAHMTTISHVYSKLFCTMRLRSSGWPKYDTTTAFPWPCMVTMCSYALTTTISLACSELFYTTWLWLEWDLNPWPP